MAGGLQDADDPASDMSRITESNILTSVDLETALRKAGFGKFNYLMLLLAIPASSTSAYVSGTMSFVVPVAGPDLGLTPTTKALIQSSPYAGMICSAFLWGVLSDSFGRQRLMAAGFLLDFIMNTLCALIPNLYAILLFKFLSGFMVCGPFSIFMAYISEVFMDKRRDIAVLSLGIFACLVQILHVLIAFAVIPTDLSSWVPLKSWQMFILLCGVPSLLTGVASAFCVESPKFLADKGRTEEALAVCRRIYAINTGLSSHTYPVKTMQMPMDTSTNNTKISAVKKLCGAIRILRPPYINRLLMVFGIQVSFIITLNLIRLWLPEMLTVMSNADPETANQTTTLCPLLLAGHEAVEAGSQIVSNDHVYYDMMILHTFCLLAQFVFIVAVKYIRKKFIIMSVAGIAMGLVISIPNINSAYVFIPASLTVAVLGLAFFALIALVVDIFPTNVRATSVSTTLMVGRLGMFAANFFVANLMYTYCEYMFYCLAVLCLSIVIICAFLNTTPFVDPSVKEKNEPS